MIYCNAMQIFVAYCPLDFTSAARQINPPGETIASEDDDAASPCYTVTLSVSEEDTIAEVKRNLGQRIGEPDLGRFMPRLILNGRQLLDDRTVRESHIQRHDTIRWVPRLRGD